MNNEILSQLARPFHPSHITWKPGVFNRDKTKAMALAYADLRAYQSRLDEVCGMNWSVTYSPWGDRLVCHLAICGVTRSSTGEPDSQSERSEIAGTAAEAQAFKRACAMFGLGRYLYQMPSLWIEFDGERRQFSEQGKVRLNNIIIQHYQRHVGEDATQDGGFNVDGQAAHADKVMADLVSGPAPKEDQDLLRELRVEFDSLGMSIYGKEWERVRRYNTERLTGGQESDHEKLETGQLIKLINGLQKLQRQTA